MEKNTAQGAIEYLLIVGAAILVVAILIIALSSILQSTPSNNGNINDIYNPINENKASMLNKEFIPSYAVKEFIYDGEDTLSIISLIGTDLSQGTIVKLIKDGVETEYTFSNGSFNSDINVTPRTTVIITGGEKEGYANATLTQAKNNFCDSNTDCGSEEICTGFVEDSMSCECGDYCIETICEIVEPGEVCEEILIPCGDETPDSMSCECGDYIPDSMSCECGDYIPDSMSCIETICWTDEPLEYCYEEIIPCGDSMTCECNDKILGTCKAIDTSMCNTTYDLICYSNEDCDSNGICVNVQPDSMTCECGDYMPDSMSCIETICETDETGEYCYEEIIPCGDETPDSMSCECGDEFGGYCEFPC